MKYILKVIRNIKIKTYRGTHSGYVRYCTVVFGAISLSLLWPIDFLSFKCYHNDKSCHGIFRPSQLSLFIFISSNYFLWYFTSQTLYYLTAFPLKIIPFGSKPGHVSISRFLSLVMNKENGENITVNQSGIIWKQEFLRTEGCFSTTSSVCRLNLWQT